MVVVAGSMDTKSSPGAGAGSSSEVTSTQRRPRWPRLSATLTSRPLSRLVATEETRLDRAFMLMALLRCCAGSSNSGSVSAKLLSAVLGLAWPGALSELCRPSLPAATEVI